MYLMRRLGQHVSGSTVQALYEAERATCAAELLMAMETIQKLLISFCKEYGDTSDTDLEHIRADARARTAALAVHALTTFHGSGVQSKIMSLWLTTYPADATAKMRLLM